MSSADNPEANKALMRRWFEQVWNQGRADVIPEIFAADGIAHGLSEDPAKPLRGPTGVRGQRPRRRRRPGRTGARGRSPGDRRGLTPGARGWSPRKRRRPGVGAEPRESVAGF